MSAPGIQLDPHTIAGGNPAGGGGYPTIAAMSAPEIQLDPHKIAGGNPAGGGGSPTQQSSENMDPSIHRNGSKKLTLLPLIFLIYFEVAGGAYGAVQAAGPLYALLGFLIFPFIWGVPESLVTAELATSMPGNGGFIIWAERAFGPVCGSLMGTWKLLSSIINSAAFPALCVDYISRVYPSVAGEGPRNAMLAGMNLALSFINYAGVTVVGYTAVALGAASLAPFVLMTAIAVPKLRPERWLRRGTAHDWRLFLNTLFWNLNFWDSASTMAGEVDSPERTFPTALLASGVMTALCYLLPLMAGTGAIDAPQGAWGGGYFADAAATIAGRWLKNWIEVGAVISAIGLYEAQLSSCAFQLLGMADLGLLPKVFRSRAKWFGTPWAGILFCSSIIVAVSFMTFNDIINSANFLYSLGMLLEFASFLWLRRKEPDLKRPYRVPLPLPALAALCLIPSALLLFLMAIAGWRVLALSAGATGFGLLVYYLMKLCKARGWLEFYRRDDNAEDVLGAAPA